MIEMRQDCTTRAWILVGHSEGDSGWKETVAASPYCPYHKAETPPTLAAIIGSDRACLQWEEEFYVNSVTPEEAARQLLEMAAGLWDGRPEPDISVCSLPSSHGPCERRSA